MLRERDGDGDRDRDTDRTDREGDRDTDRTDREGDRDTDRTDREGDRDTDRTEREGDRDTERGALRTAPERLLREDPNPPRRWPKARSVVRERARMMAIQFAVLLMVVVPRVLGQVILAISIPPHSTPKSLLDKVLGG